MTLYGGIHRLPGKTRVTTVGSFPNDGWVEVGRLPNTKLPTLPGRYALQVMGKVGYTQWSGNLPDNGMVQVRLGDTSGFRHPDYAHQFSIKAALGPLNGIPFSFMAILDGAGSGITDPLWGGTWTGAEELRVMARTYRNGDAPTYSAEFDVADLVFMWWNLDDIPAASYYAEDHWPATPTVIGPLAGGFQPVFAASGLVGAIGEDWLHMFATDYTPRDSVQYRGPWMQSGYLTAGSWGNFVSKVGTHRWGKGHQAGVYRATTAEQTRFSGGAFFPLTQPTGAGFAPAIRAKDTHNFAGAGTLLHKYRLLSIKLDDLVDVDWVTHASQSVCVDYGVQTYIAWEPALAIASQPTVLMHGIPRVLPGTNMSYDWVITSNEARLFWESLLHGDTRSPDEGISTIAAFTRGIGASAFSGSREVAYNAFSWQDALTAPTGLVRDLNDVHFVQFNFETDPSRVVPVPAIPGTPIVIVPAREAIDTASLSEPPHDPDGEVNETAGMPYERISGVSGYVRQWPQYTGPRRIFSLVHRARTKAEADALLVFYRANPAFKWTPQHETANVPLVITQRPTAVPSAPAHYDVTLQATELVFVGP